jgi:S-adenosylmethionine:tRNA ribosyltransferase-isomerase
MEPLTSGTPLDLLDAYGTMPLPPYIERSPTDADRERYQTTYATQPGSVAAPTAGLHFTPELLSRCRERGIELAEVTLHVGLGTFRPVSAEDLSRHVMHAEWCEISEATGRRLSEVRRRGGRIVAVGTTSARTLESAQGRVGWHGWRGETDLFIRPPYEFRAVDALLTNFHLPKSTLLMLVSALAGIDLIRRAYAEAIAHRYRFFSYGDAMLIV